jgi:arylsulfatase A-like enzyme
MAISRREAIKTVGGGLVAAALGANQRARPEEPMRPNILWISCEDISQHLGCYGDPHAKTPVLDRLAEQGVRYTHGFTVAGVCAPSRCGIITGMYPSSLGTGYMRCVAQLPAHVKCFTEYLRAAGYYCTNNAKTDYQFKHPPSAWDDCSKKGHWRNRAPGQPFFSVFNLEITHESQYRTRGEEYAKKSGRLKPADRQDPGALTTLPPYYADTAETRRDWAQYYELTTVMDYQAGDLLKQLEEDGLTEDTIVLWWSDNGVGFPRAKRWLYDSGCRMPMIARIPERFRVEGQGKPGTVDDRMISFLDLGPTVLNLAGVPVRGHMDGQPFLGPDLPAARKYIFGARDRMDERYDIIRTVRDSRYRYIHHYEPFFPYYQRLQYREITPTMIELRRLHAEGKLPPAAEQFCADRKPIEELYDTVSDPHEVHNLAESPEHRQELQRLRRVLREWMVATKDLALIPEAEVVELEKRYGNRYDILRAPENRGLPQRLFEVVEAGEAGHVPKLRKALRDPQPAVRYWAAVWLGDRRTQEAEDDLRGALADDSPIVRVAAARALCRMGRAEEGLPVLIGALQDANEFVRLRAATELDYLDEIARPALEALRKARDEDESNYVKRLAEQAVRELEATR